MTSRYNDKIPVLNAEEQYQDTFDKRGINFIQQYSTPELSHPTYQQILRLNRKSHVWKTGDRFYKLASTYYGNEKYWWIIAWYNQTPTEHHVEMGQILKIPTPLYKVLSILRLK